MMLKEQLKIQMRVIAALLMREILIRYGRHNIGFLWIIIEPMLFTIGVTVLWSIMKIGHHSDLPITAFALTGYSSVLLWRNTINRCNLAIRANSALLHHHYIGVFHLFIARIILEISSVTMSFMTLALFFISTGLMEIPANMLILFCGWFLLAWFALSLALVIGSISELSDVIERLWHAASYLLFPLSGAGFMVEWLPPASQKILLWLPILNGVELIREGMFGSLIKTHYSVVYLIFSSAFLTLLGLALSLEVNKKLDYL